jgi:hypothetical protein
MGSVPGIGLLYLVIATGVCLLILPFWLAH